MSSRETDLPPPPISVAICPILLLYRDESEAVSGVQQGREEQGLLLSSLFLSLSYSTFTLLDLISVSRLAVFGHPVWISSCEEEEKQNCNKQCVLDGSYEGRQATKFIGQERKRGEGEAIVKGKARSHMLPRCAVSRDTFRSACGRSCCGGSSGDGRSRAQAASVLVVGNGTEVGTTLSGAT